MVKPLEASWVSLQVGWGSVLGNHRGGVNVVNWVNRDSDIMPTVCAGWVGEGSAKDHCLLPHNF